MHGRLFYNLSQLLSKLDSAYFTIMDTQVVLDTIPDKAYATFLARPEEAANRVQQRVSSDNIPTGPEVTSQMCLQENIKCFDHKGQRAVTRLFSHLQDAHNHMAEVAKAIIDVSEVSSPEQFTFVLQLAVRPIIQLQGPSAYNSVEVCFCCFLLCLVLLLQLCQRFLLLRLCSNVLRLLGNVVRVYPRIVQGLTFLLV